MLELALVRPTASSKRRRRIALIGLVSRVGSAIAATEVVLVVLVLAAVAQSPMPSLSSSTHSTTLSSVATFLVRRACHALWRSRVALACEACVCVRAVVGRRGLGVWVVGRLVAAVGVRIASLTSALPCRHRPVL